MQRSKEITKKNEKEVVTLICCVIHFIVSQRELKVMQSKIVILSSIIELLPIIELLNIQFLSLYFLNYCVLTRPSYMS